jgi:AbiEi antitoxin C-terminal domain
MPPHAREMAAVLACGSGAVLSYRSAAALWGLLPYPANSGPVHVTVLAADRRRPGIRIHRVRELPSDEVTRRHGIPITTPERTILDLAGEVMAAELEQAVATAERSHFTTRAKPRSLRPVIADGQAPRRCEPSSVAAPARPSPARRSSGGSST